MDISAYVERRMNLNVSNLYPRNADVMMKFRFQHNKFDDVKSFIMGML